MENSSGGIQTPSDADLEEHKDVHNQSKYAHTHTHWAVDPIISTERGIWAVKWSFIGLMVTAVLQILVVYISGSVALLADTIHNFGDAATTIPLGFAFILARRKANKRFTYDYGIEGLAGVVIVFLILFNALVAAYECTDRIFHARADGYTSLAVLFGAIGVWLGCPLADSIIGLVITLAILHSGTPEKLFLPACSTEWTRES
ncbi:Cobalt-zinc-cadmium resistance protein [Methanosarcina siciliae T4/M]|uniref:Cobalt-zinc-cadmium resistance protein n=1 Tax=Methanosarcina siciliae T4/M TaxID=1434120 RepID=A0A0E3P0X6_9EURY|nr:cation transporter [Methanosarcina siciliae]AKB27020.1 Cobalt-zinc-cadmium resistance protein [Methanosarcina siciliae T4/M]